jgi:hypothetical protein
MTLSRRFVWLAALVTGLMVSACGSGGMERSGTAPPEIRGRWITDDARYGDRAFEILEDSLVFEVGDGELTTHSIESLLHRPDPRGAAFEIDHTVPEGGLMTFSFTYVPTEDAIYFKNQARIKWTRAPSGP